MDEKLLCGVLRDIIENSLGCFTPAHYISRAISGDLTVVDWLRQVESIGRTKFIGYLREDLQE